MSSGWPTASTKGSLSSSPSFRASSVVGANARPPVGSLRCDLRREYHYNAAHEQERIPTHSFWPSVASLRGDVSRTKPFARERYLDMIWRCPNCHSPLHPVENSWRCEQGHSFDKAKQGYTNLLLPNQKSSRDPGDSQAMIQSRRRFLQAGHYQPLADGIAELWGRLAAESGGANGGVKTLLDIGCGEGYYLRALSESSRTATAAELYGLDISREAVKRAATALPSASFCVASSYRLPVQDQSADVVLQVFAPGDDQEVLRVLTQRGAWIKVSPGPRHLYQLKQALYQQVREHPPVEMPSGFRVVEQEQIRFAMQLKSSEAIADLLAMTPLAWRGSAEGKQQLLECDALGVEADFVLQLLVRGNGDQTAAF